MSPNWNNKNPSENEQSIEGAQFIFVISLEDESLETSESPSKDVYTVIVYVPKAETSTVCSNV